MISGFGRTLAEIQSNPGQHANEDLKRVKNPFS